MTDFSDFDQRPIIVAIAGSNGAGKTTFFHTHLAATGLRFINADVLSAELAEDPYTAAQMADVLRRTLVAQRESFVFETVFSDPAGEKVAFLQEAARVGYTVILCFIGISDPEMSSQRVAMRVSQGGHDVPEEKLRARFPRTLANLRAAISRLPNVLIYDHSDLSLPYRHVAMFRSGQACHLQEPLPAWLDALIR